MDLQIKKPWSESDECPKNVYCSRVTKVGRIGLVLDFHLIPNRTCICKNYKNIQMDKQDSKINKYLFSKSFNLSTCIRILHLQCVKVKLTTPIFLEYSVKY